MKLKKLHLTICLLTVFTMGFAESNTVNKTMTLDEVCQMAIENSTHLKMAKVGVETASVATKVAKSAFSPEVKLSASASYIGNGYITDRYWANGESVEMPQ